MRRNHQADFVWYSCQNWRYSNCKLKRHHTEFFRRTTLPVLHERSFLKANKAKTQHEAECCLQSACSLLSIWLLRRSCWGWSDLLRWIGLNSRIVGHIVRQLDDWTGTGQMHGVWKYDDSEKLWKAGTLNRSESAGITEMQEKGWAGSCPQHALRSSFFLCFRLVLSRIRPAAYTAAWAVRLS